MKFENKLEKFNSFARFRIWNHVIRQRTKVTDTTHFISMLKWQWAGHISRKTDNRWGKRVLEWIPRLGKRSVERPQARWEWRFAQDGWQELDASSRRLSEMARSWRGLCMMMMMNSFAQFDVMLTVRTRLACFTVRPKLKRHSIKHDTICNGIEMVIDNDFSSQMYWSRPTIWYKQF
jgi:hypothetical protein